MNFSGKINKHNVEEILSLSPMQEGMLYHYLKNPSSNQYYEQLSLNISGKLDIEIYKKAWLFLVEGNEILRTIFAWKRLNKPVQIFLKNTQISFKENDFSGIIDKEKKQGFLDKVKQDDLKDKFNLETYPLFRVTLCKVAHESYEMILSHHHIIFDGWSTGIILKEFFKAYTAFSQGKSLQSPKKTSFRQYLKWLEDRDIDSEKNYWQKYLAGLENKSYLPADSYQHGELLNVNDYEFKIADTLTEKINTFVKNEGVTVASLLNACWGILLQRYNNSKDVLFGATISGRPAEIPGIEEMVGLFLNTIPVRFNHEKEETVIKEIIKTVNADAIKRKNYEHLPLVEIKNLTELATEDTLFESLLVVENYPLEEVLTDINCNLRVNSYSTFEMTNYNLTIIISLFDGIKINFIYNSDTFREKTIKRIGNYLTKILDEVLKNPEEKVSKLDLLFIEEKNRLLVEFNNTEKEFIENKVIHQLFAEQAEKMPDNIAIINSDKKVTYGQLNEKANQLARTLFTKGVKQETIVAIMAEPSIEMVTGIMAILKTGAAYLPLSPDLPKERIKYMLTDSGTEILLTESQFKDKFDPSIEVLNLNQAEIYADDKSNLKNKSDFKNLAYIIYTSGSTGKPKGVLVEHGSLLNTLAGLQQEYPIDQGDIWLLKTTFMFDVSLTEIFGWIIGGGSLAVLEAGGEKDPKRILEAIADYKITHMNFVPSMFNLFIDYVETKGEKAVKIINQLKYLMVAGEAISQEQVQRFYNLTKEVEFINLYGPTEATIYATQFPLKDADKYRTVPIGKGVANAKLYILDKDANLQPIGFPGELCIGGKGLARGYLNRSDLNKEKFIDNPFRPGERIYRTGDLACWLPDGNIEFLGRLDHQVKVRGYRVELGEIEAQLLGHPLVKEAVVVIRGNKSDKYLIAYYVSDKEIELEEFHYHLEEKLPEYMIPPYFVKIDKMPLSRSGKTDRKSLPDFNGEIKSDVEYVAPSNEIEIKLVEIWSDILELDKIGVNNNFFRLGGHSLKATRLVARVIKEFAVELPLQEIFNNPTVKGLAEYIQKAEKQKYYKIEQVEERTYYPVSSNQKRLFLLEELNELDTTYNMSTVLMIEDELDKERFENIFQRLIERHESFRTSFEMVDGQIVQKIIPNVNFKMDSFVADNETKIEEIIEDFIKPFDLSHAPLMRVGLIQSGNKYFILIDIHHIISDGVSMEILIDEFVRLYQKKELPELRIQYKDFAIWQKEFLKSERLQAQKEYWRDTFADEIYPLDLPLDYLRPAEIKFAGASINFKLNSELTDKINQMAMEENVTLYMILLDLFNILLSKYSGQEDIIVGSPISGRNYAEVDSIIGMFVNTLAMRNYPEGEKSFTQFLAEIKENSLQAYQNQDYPFEMLIEEINVIRDLSRNALFDVMFALENMDDYQITIDNLNFISKQLNNQTAKFDMSLSAVERNKEIVCSLEYSTELFKKETIERLEKHFVNVVKEVILNPDIRLNEIEMISEKEKQQLLFEFNRTDVYYLEDKIIHQLFEEQVEITPNNVALIYKGEELTYQELNEQSNQLARLLREKGVRSDQFVGLMVYSSFDLIIGIMGILKAGGAYLPIDPEYPKERIDFMLKDSNATVLLTQNSLITKGTVVSDIIDLEDQNNYRGAISNLEITNKPEDLIYVIYTSGSTGKPKGVMVEHRNVRAYIHAFKEEFELTTEDVVLQQASYAFDASVEEIFPILTTGGKLVLTKKDEIRDINVLFDVLKEKNVTVLSCSPLLLNEINKMHPINSVHTYISGADVLKAEYISNIRKYAKVYNTYGPTESTVCATYYECTECQKTNIPIGKPIINYRAYILDKKQHLVPIGVAGELCIAGDGITRGYLNRPELTAEKFIENPYIPGEKIYRTGDLSRMLPDGNIEFLGRIDHQVKVRGYRIELGEIEAKLLSLELIKETVVITHTDDINKYIAAYYIADEELKATKIRENLKKELPDYMIPSYFIQLEKMPLTSNGKIDRKALPSQINI